jgi:hypothetical protein
MVLSRHRKDQVSRKNEREVLKLVRKMRAETQNDVDFKEIARDEERDRIDSVLDNLTISDDAENQLNDLKKKMSDIFCS